MELQKHEARTLRYRDLRHSTYWVKNTQVQRRETQYLLALAKGLPWLEGAF